MFTNPSLRRARLHVTAVIITLGLLAALASACGRHEQPVSSGTTDGSISRANKNVVVTDEKPRTGGKLVYALISETNGWNPATNQWAPSGLIVARQIFDTI